MRPIDQLPIMGKVPVKQANTGQLIPALVMLGAQGEAIALQQQVIHMTAMIQHARSVLLSQGVELIDKKPGTSDPRVHAPRMERGDGGSDSGKEAK